MSAIALPIARALAALEAHADRSSGAVVFRPGPAPRRGVYGGGAGLAYARLALDAVAPLTSVDRVRIARGLAETIGGEAPEIGYLDGVGSELEILAHAAEGTAVDVAEIASALLPRVEDAVLAEGMTDADLLGGLAGAALTLSCVATLAGRAPREDVVVSLARRLGASVLLAPRGLAIRSPGSRRPLLGLTHGASGVAWAIEHLATEGGGTRVIAEGLRAYVASREDDGPEGWLDDRNDPRAAPTANTSYCHGSFGIFLAAGVDAEGARTRARAIAHLRREASAGGTGSLAVCHGDPSTLVALRASGYDEAADRLRRRLEVALCAHPLDDVGDGLFTSALGALVCLVLDEPIQRRSGPPFPWLPSSRHLGSLGEAFDVMLASAASAALPESSRGADHEALRAMLAAAASGALFVSDVEPRLERLAPPLLDDVARARLYWSFPDDVFVRASARTERAAGRNAARAVRELGGDARLMTSRRVGFLVRRPDRPPTILVHEGDVVESVEVDEELFDLLAFARSPVALEAIERRLHALGRPVRPREAVGALFVLGLLTFATSNQELYA